MKVDDQFRSQVFNAIESEKGKRDRLYDEAVEGAYGELCFSFLLSKCMESFRLNRPFEFIFPKSRKLPEWARIGLNVMSKRKYCVVHTVGKKTQRWSITAPRNIFVDLME